MTVNLHSTYAKQIQNKFVAESLVTGRLSNDYSWSGVKTVKISTPITVPMTDYVRSGMNRYGNPTEMQDMVQELTLSQDKSFTLTVDKGNNEDQNGIKAAGKILSLQIAERAVPTMDTYVFSALVKQAGNIVGNAEALTTANICERISAGTLLMDEAEVPANDRTLYLTAEAYKLLKHSDEFMAVTSLAEKALAKGMVGMYDNMTVIKVPSCRFPANVNFMIVHKNAATAPVKLNDTRIHIDPPGISGALLEGRQYYDCFVFGVKCDGIYVDANTAEGKGTVVATPKITKAGAITCDTAAAVIKYTVDGSDPRYSPTAEIYTTTVSAAGKTVKAYAYLEGCFNSAVAEAVLS